MIVKFPVCQVIGVDRFNSKKGTACGVLRWYDQMEGKVYRTMVFNDDVALLNGVETNMQVSVSLAVQGSRRDDSIELYLCEISAPDAR